MTKKENLMAALRGEVPEVVPCCPLIHWRFTERLLGRYHWKDVLEVHRLLGSTWFRGPISIGPHSDYDARWNMPSVLIEQDGLKKIYERTITTSKGTLKARHTIGFDAKDPTLGFQQQYFVKNIDDWKIVLAYWEDEWENAPPPAHDEIDEAYEYMAQDGVASVLVNSAYARICLMRGMEGTLLDMLERPDLMREVYRAALALRKKEIQSFLESKGEVYVSDICWATGAGMSPTMFQEWLFDELAQTVDMVHQGNKYVGFYTLGRVAKLMPTIAAAKPDFAMTFEPNEGDMTLAQAKRLYGKDMCIIGNYDPAVLQFGTVEQARTEALRCLREGMENGGYVLFTGCEVPTTAKWDNLKAMVEVSQEFGRY